MRVTVVSIVAACVAGAGGRSMPGGGRGPGRRAGAARRPSTNCLGRNTKEVQAVPKDGAQDEQCIDGVALTLNRLAAHLLRRFRPLVLKKRLSSRTFIAV